MTGDRRQVLTDTIEIPLPPPAAFRLFTARGERDWAPGWAPRFPAGEGDVGGVADDVPGTVFLTDHHGLRTTWIVVESRPGELIRYARVTAGGSAGTVCVALAGVPTGTRVTVGYDLTALDPGAEHELDAFAAGYRAYLDSWQEQIEQFLAQGREDREDREDREEATNDRA